MKRIVLLLATLGICCWAGAQEHLKFKNIPIDGSKKAFVEALCQNEFHLVNDGDFGAALSGRFTGKTVDVFVMPTSEGITSRVAVNYPSPDNWGNLRLDFYTLLKRSAGAGPAGTPGSSLPRGPSTSSLPTIP